MRNLTLLGTIAGAAIVAAPATAQDMPPADGLPLSQIVAAVEEAHPVQAFSEVEWDDDGYWDVEFVDTENRKVSIRIDPLTGEPWSRPER